MIADSLLLEVNVFYSHGPDRETPLLHLVTEMNKLHKEGKFNQVRRTRQGVFGGPANDQSRLLIPFHLFQFGLSNYNSKEVAEICDVRAGSGVISDSFSR